MNGLFLWFVTHHKRNKNKIDRQGAQSKELFPAAFDPSGRAPGNSNDKPRVLDSRQ
jgi:hypothetical protein